MRWGSAAAVTLLALAACSDGPDDPRGLLTLEGTPPRFDIERGRDGNCSADYRAQVSALDLATGTERWILDVPVPDGGQQLVNDLLVSRSANYPNDPPSVYALGAQDGQARWQREVASSGYETPAISGDTVVTRDGEVLVALSADDGNERWRFATSGELVHAAGDGVVAVVNDGGDVQLLDANTGDVSWTATSDVEPVLALTMAPAVVVVHGADAQLAGLDLATGEHRWSIPAEPGRTRQLLGVPSQDVLVWAELPSGDPAAPPSDRGTELVAIDLGSGQVTWRIATAGYGYESAVMVGDLLVIPHTATLEAVDVTSGETRWTAPMGEARQISTPVPGQLLVAVPEPSETGVIASTTLYALDATSGAPAWSASLPVGTTGPVAGAGGLLLVGGGAGLGSESVDSDDDGLVVALASRDGTEQWRTVRRDAADQAITVRDDTAVVLSADQRLFCD
jgi:outer membrane protein assembly factor BamB